MRTDEKEARKSYNNFAEYYHSIRTKKGGWFYNELLEMPATLELLGNVKGKKILDFGCGTGIYARKLTQKGAKVYGFDISNEMLEIAKKYAPKATLCLASGYKIPCKGKFDIVIASLVLDYFEEWNRVFKDINKHLKKGGIFIFSMPNPVSECVKRIKYKGKVFKTLGDYFTEKKSYVFWTGAKNKKLRIPQYHKTYETVIKTILKNGFEIIDYRDAFPLKRAKKLFPKDYKIFSKSPYFCVWKLRKK